MCARHLLGLSSTPLEWRPKSGDAHHHERDAKSHPPASATTTMALLRSTLAFSCLLAAASGFGISRQQRSPLLPAQRRPYAPVSVVRMQAELAAVPDEPTTPVGLKARVAAMLPPKKEMQKLVRHLSTRLTIHRVSPSDRAAHSTPTTTRNGGRSLWPRCSSASCSRTRFCATPRTCWCAPPPAQRQPSSAL